MATVRWVGGAPAVAQVDTLTVGGTVEVGDLFLMSLGNKTLSVAAASTSPATVATAIAAAWNALSTTSYPEFAEVTAAATSGGALTLTADTAGVAFSVSVSTTESDGSPADAQTFSRTATTANAGPNAWDSAANWSGGAVPVNSDDVVIEDSADDIQYGLAQTAVTLASLTVRQSFTGTLGLPAVNAGTGGASYPEYRQQYLAIKATTATFGEGSGTGSGMLKWDASTAQTALTVYGTGSGAQSDLEALLWKGTHASNVVNVQGGSVGAAGFGGESATVATLRVGGDASVRCGAGCTLTTVTNAGGTLDLFASCTTLNHLAGTTTVHGSATVTTATIDGGTLAHLSSGTVTTLKVGSDAKADFTGDLRGRTVTNCTVYGGAEVDDRYATVTWTNGLVLTRCDLDEVTLRLGQGRTLTPS